MHEKNEFVISCFEELLTFSNRITNFNSEELLAVNNSKNTMVDNYVRSGAPPVVWCLLAKKKHWPGRDSGEVSSFVIRVVCNDHVLQPLPKLNTKMVYKHHHLYLIPQQAHT